MFLENLGIDADDPIRRGRFWEAALGTTALTVEPDIYETRLDLDGDAYLDLCFARVPEHPTSPLRLHLDLRGGERQLEVAERLRGLGARDLDIGQGEVPWIVLGDVEGAALCVMEEREEYTDTGPLAALPLDVADPQREGDFWAWLTGWVETSGQAPRTLRHPSRRGPLLSLYPEPEPKRPGAKNPIHLDIRLEAGDDVEAITAEIAERGGRELHPGWGELPWRIYQDPSGNEFCLLPAPGAAS
ncbi:VOC family protein [Brachybacterium fresconis]|uniref:Enzyme related to lactoylglutathione lyase n=1 Tax=Brachybacterium fresconis TaxID=173363 RepID=A0ABS4YPT9_9MICO|nr:VOC family protein [Brachybacterium fresconis]MBP2410397.1 putative enzyme related to lactoylglutathione lyase [Brachybacterium fresconis]